MPSQNSSYLQHTWLSPKPAHREQLSGFGAHAEMDSGKGGTATMVCDRKKGIREKEVGS